MTPSPNNVYIQQGRIVRRTSFFDWTRFFFIVSIAVVLFVTNPANEPIRSFLPKQFRKQLLREKSIKPSSPSSSSSSSSSWMWKKSYSSSYSSTIFTTTNTNYGIFSLQKRASGVSISGLLRVAPLCRLDSSSAESYACDMIAKTVCHGKPLLWDPFDRAHTAHRILCCLMLMMATLQFCMPLQSPPYWKHNFIFDHLASALLVNNSLIYTLLDLNIFVYPALRDMDNLVPTLNWQVYGDPNWTFAVAVVVLVVVIGGGANSVASLCVGKYTYGWGPIVAASLSYSQAVGQRSLWLFGLRFVTPVNTFWVRFLSLVFGNFGASLAWLLAGVAGFMLGDYHQGNQTVWRYWRIFL